MNGLNQQAVVEWGGPRKQATTQKHIKCAVAELVGAMNQESHRDVFRAVQTAMISLEAAMQALGAERGWVCGTPFYEENGQ